MDTVVFRLFLAGVITLPLALAGVPQFAWTSYSVVIGLLLCLGLFASGITGSSNEARKIAVPLALNLVFCAYVAFQAISWPVNTGLQHPVWAAAAIALPGTPMANSLALDSTATLDALTRFLAYTGTFWLAFLFARSSQRASQMLKVFVIAAASYATYGLIVFSFFDNTTVLWFEKYTYLPDLTSTFINRNSFSTYAGIGVIASLAWLIKNASGISVPSAEWRMKIVAITEQGLPILTLPLITFLTLLAALFLTHSRGGLLSTFGGIITLTGLLACRKKNRKLLLPVLICVLFVSIFIFGLGELTLDRIITTSMSTEERSKIYAIMMEAIQLRPWTGYGYGNFEQAFPMFLDDNIRHYYDRGHNDYLELILGVGIPAALCPLLMIAWLTIRCVIGVLTRRRYLVFPALGAACTVLVGIHSTMDFSLQMPAVAASFAFLLGLGTGQAWSISADSEARPAA